MTHEESVVWIALNDARCAVLACSPHEAEPLAVGHLLSQGWIVSPDDVMQITVEEGPGGSIGVRVQSSRTRSDEIKVLHAHQTLYGCGIRHYLDCDPGALPRVAETRAEINAVTLLRSLFAAAERDVVGGGVHAAALSDGIELATISYDVARHSAMDRAVGAGALKGMDLSGAGLVSTARVSAAMVLKAVRCKIGWMASRSIATTLARDIARHHGVTLLERAGARRRDA